MHNYLGNDPATNKACEIGTGRSEPRRLYGFVTQKQLFKTRFYPSRQFRSCQVFKEVVRQATCQLFFRLTSRRRNFTAP